MLTEFQDFDGGSIVPEEVAVKLLRLARPPWYRRLWHKMVHYIRKIGKPDKEELTC